MRALFPILPVLLFVAPVASAGLFGDETTPLLDEGGGAGSGWVSYWFQTNSSNRVVVFQVAAMRGDYPNAAGVLFYDASGTSLGGFSYYALNANKDGDALRVHVLNQTLVDIDQVSLVPLNGGIAIQFSATFRNAGTYGVIMFGVGAPGPAWSPHAWQYALRSSSAMLLAKQESNDAYAFTAKDFEGTLSYRSNQGGPGMASQLWVSVALSKSITLHRHMVGFYEDVSTADVTGPPPASSIRTQWLTMREPSVEQHCPCYALGLDHAAGTYTFGLTGASGLASSSTDPRALLDSHAMLLVLDAELPA